MSTLRITEIFYSLQGEARTVGIPTVFVRLTGCPLRCHYCDTEYAFHGGQVISLEEILTTVAGYKAQYVCVTGGEPMAQRNCVNLLSALCDKGYQVSLETSGAMDLSEVDSRVSKVVDLKTPASGEVEKNCYNNLKLVTGNDQIKFVICNQDDYLWAKFKLDEYQLLDKGTEILFSPSFGQVESKQLAEWILSDNLPVRMQLQLHKIIWGDKPGH